MQIGDLARQSGVPAKTIRYYESLGLLPQPARDDNNYRDYEPSALERLCFIVSARRLGFALTDISSLLAARDHDQAPCEQVLDALNTQLASIDRRIADLLALRADLQRIRTLGEQLPRDRGESGPCVCYLITAYRDSGAVTIDQREGDNG